MSTPSVGRSSLVMASGTLTSRLLGMVRGILVASVMGLVLTGGTFDVANTLPNNIYQLIAGGILGAVLVPQIAKAASHDDGGDDFVNRLLTLSITLMFLATVVATAAAPLLVRLYASPSWGAQELALSTIFALICLPQIFFYGLTALLGQVLNARHRFAAYMWAPVLANVIAIAGVLIFRARSLPRGAPAGEWTPEMIWLIAGSTTLGIVVQALFLFIPLRRSGYRFRPTWGFRGVGLGSASRVAMWTFAALVVSQLGFVVISQVLTHADKVADGLGAQSAGKSVYSNAFLLFMLPHSLITISLVTALFTRLSYAAHSGNRTALMSDLRSGLAMTGVLLIPITGIGVVLAPFVTRAIYLGNSVAGTNAMAWVLAAMLLGLVPFGWNYLIQRVFYVYEDAKTPFWLQVILTVIATVVNLACFALPPQWVGVGVGVGQTISNVVVMVVGFVLLRRLLGPLSLGSVIRDQGAMLAATGLGMAATTAVATVSIDVMGGTRTGAVVVVLFAGAIGILVTLIAASVIRVGELDEMLDPVFNRLGTVISRNK